MMASDDFSCHISGLPSNDPIEIPDEEKDESTGDPQLDDILHTLLDIDGLKKTIPPEQLKQLETAAKLAGESLDDVLKQSAEATKKYLLSLPKDKLKNMLQSGNIPFTAVVNPDNSKSDDTLTPLPDIDEENEVEAINEIAKLLGLNSDDLSKDSSETDDETPNFQAATEKEKPNYELGKIQYLVSPQYFGYIPCKIDADIYQKFADRFGTDNIDFPKLLGSLKGHNLDKCNLDSLSIADIKDYNNSFIILKCSSVNEDELGLYMAVIENPTGDFELVLPIYGNTFNILTKSLYNINTNPELFLDDGRFALEDHVKLETGVTMSLAEQKEHIVMRPKDFGTIATTRVSFKDDSNWLKVGRITSNESKEAILLKKDGELDLSEKTFDFYFRLNYSYPNNILQLLAFYISKMDLNTNAKVQNSEVSAGDNSVWINIDLGSLPENLQSWINPDGNSTF